MNYTLALNENVKPLYDTITIPKAEFYSTLKDMCHTATQFKPILYISLAILLDLIEYFMRVKFWNNNKILVDYKYYKLDTNEIIILLSSAKTFCLIIALFFIIFGVNIYG